MDELEPVELIKKNAQLVIDQLGSQSEVNFGLNKDSVVWVEGFIERQRVRSDLDPTTKDKLWNIFGSFLGECIIANAGGTWQWSEEYKSWCVAFSDNNCVFPFNKVRKLFTNGLESGDSIVSFYEVAMMLAAGRFENIH